MNLTDDRGYPYPQCDPPLVKDALDLPGQLKALADAIEADLVDVDAAIDEVRSGPAAELSWTTGSQSLIDGAEFAFQSTTFDQHGMADLPGNQLVTPTYGLYVIVGYAAAPAFAADSYCSLGIRIDHANTRRQTVRPTVAGTAARMNVVYYRVLAAGQTIQMYQRSSVTNSWDGAKLSAALLAKL